MSFDDLEESNIVQNDFKNALDVELWRVKREDLDELCDNLIKNIENNYKKAKTAFKTKFAEAVAPGQSSHLLDILSDDESFPEDTIDENLKTMNSIYDSTDNFGKIVALSMVSQQFSKPTLMDHFQCLKRKVDESHSLHLISKGIQLPKNKSIHRARLDIAKCEHFLDFMFHNGLLQDVAYGITNLKYSICETQTIPHAVTTASYK